MKTKLKKTPKSKPAGRTSALAVAPCSALPTLYVLISPSGEIFPRTLGTSKSDVWGLHGGFLYVATKEGDDWKFKYWKRWDESLRSARRLGYKITPCSVVPNAEVCNETKPGKSKL